MLNPFSEKARGIIYIIGIVVGAGSAIIGPLLSALEVSGAWEAVIITAVGVVMTLTSTLSRLHLGELGIDKTPATEVGEPE
jgi:low affinity Fe/Cu permease